MAWEEEEVEEKNIESESKPKKGGSMKLFIIIGAIIILAGAAGGVYFFLMGNNNEEKIINENGEEEIDDLELETDIYSQRVFEVDELIVNLSDPGGKRYLIIEIKIILRSEEALERIKSNPIFLARIKDTIIMTGSAKSFDDLSTAQGKMFFREELKIRFSEFIGKNHIVDILFSKFVLS